MITLKTLSTATAQEVFDQIANHLLTQMKRSVDDQKCLYRTADGLKCAAGCLIGDDEYLPEMDIYSNNGGTTWSSLITKGMITVVEHSILIKELQKIHDYHQPFEWAEELLSYAIINNLSPTVLLKFK